MPKTILALAALFVGCSAFAQTSGGSLPSFTATSLTGNAVTAAALTGQPAILIVTPSRGAAPDTRQWAQALRKHIDTKSVRVRDVIAVDLPFFVSQQMAADQARQKIPSDYYDQTWLTAGSKLETALGIPDQSKQAVVLVLDSHGGIVYRVTGGPTKARLQQIESAVQSTK